MLLPKPVVQFMQTIAGCCALGAITFVLGCSSNPEGIDCAGLTLAEVQSDKELTDLVSWIASDVPLPTSAFDIWVSHESFNPDQKHYLVFSTDAAGLKAFVKQLPGSAKKTMSRDLNSFAGPGLPPSSFPWKVNSIPNGRYYETPYEKRQPQYSSFAIDVNKRVVYVVH
jgi:hypothetical protein